MMTERLMSPEEVADVLCVSTSTLAKWRGTGDPELPFLRIGGRIRYRSSDVDEFLESVESAEQDDEEEEDDDEPDQDDEDDED